MKVSSISNPIPREFNRKNISFTQYFKTDNTTNPEQIYFNYTWLLRDTELIQFLPQFISKKYPQKDFPQGVKIINAACSAGLESYSLALSFANNTPNELDRFFPIEASDISKVAIKAAKNNLIFVNDIEKESLKELKNVKLDDYIELYKKDYYGPEYKISQYKVNDKLKKLINFKISDVKKELTNIEKSDKPTVFIFRNALLYFNFQQKKDFIKNLHKSLKPNSTVVIGEKDNPDTEKLMLKAGFTQPYKDKPRNLIFIKP